MDDSSAGLKGGVGRGSPTPDEHPADLRQSDGDLQDRLAASVERVLDRRRRPRGPRAGRAESAMLKPTRHAKLDRRSRRSTPRAALLLVLPCPPHRGAPPSDARAWAGGFREGSTS